MSDDRKKGGCKQVKHFYKNSRLEEKNCLTEFLWLMILGCITLIPKPIELPVCGYTGVLMHKRKNSFETPLKQMYIHVFFADRHGMILAHAVPYVSTVCYVFIDNNHSKCALRCFLYTCICTIIFKKYYCTDFTLSFFKERNSMCLRTFRQPT